MSTPSLSKSKYTALPVCVVVNDSKLAYLIPSDVRPLGNLRAKRQNLKATVIAPLGKASAFENKDLCMTGIKQDANCDLSSEDLVATRNVSPDAGQGFYIADLEINSQADKFAGSHGSCVCDGLFVSGRQVPVTIKVVLLTVVTRSR